MKTAAVQHPGDPDGVPGAVRTAVRAGRRRPASLQPGTFDLDRPDRDLRLRRPPRRRLARRRRPPDLHARLRLLGAAQLPARRHRRRRRRARRTGRRGDGPHRVLPRRRSRRLGLATTPGTPACPAASTSGTPTGGPQRAAAAVRSQRRLPLRQLGVRRRPARRRRPAARLRLPARQQGRHARAPSTSRPAATASGRPATSGRARTSSSSADTATGRTAKACVDLVPGVGVNINLGAANFGLPGCPF